MNKLKKKFIFFIILSITIMLPYYDAKAKVIKSINGVAKVIDGDTVSINSSKIRLFGLDSPELDQKCKININIFFLKFNYDYSCGEFSKIQLKKKINSKDISCKILDKDRFGRYVGECFYNKQNLNVWLVENGYAIAYRKYSKKYVLFENSAKEKRLGIWRGKFEMPWDYRRKN